MKKSFLQVSSDKSRNKKTCFTQIHCTSPLRILHTFAMAIQHTIQKVLLVDFANAKSLITSSNSTEQRISASMQSREG